MKSTCPLIVGLALGIFLYGTTRHRPAPNEPPAGPVGSSGSSLARAAAITAHQAVPRTPGSQGDVAALSFDSTILVAGPIRPPRPQTNRTETATAETYALPPLPKIATTLPSKVELEISAALTSNRANSELSRLQGLLDLSRQQADEIFPILVRRSTSYGPSLRIRIGRSETSRPTPLPPPDGRTRRGPPERAPEAKPDDPEESDQPPPLEDELEEILTPPQNQALIADKLDADLWWTEIIGELAEAANHPPDAP